MPTVEVNGAELYYEEHGSGPPILLVHGTGAYADLFRPVIDGLAGSHRVIVYDRRGFGRSSAQPARRFPDHVIDAAALLRALDAAPATVVGWSGGGVIAVGLAVADPGCVTGLILAEPALHLSTHPAASTLRMQARCSIQRYLRRDPGAAAQTMYRWASGSTKGGNSFDTLPDAWRSQMTRHASSTLREMDQLLRPYPSRSAIRSITCPVTVLEGELSDPVFQVADAFTARLLPQTKVVHVAGATHYLQIDQPELWVDAVTSA